LPEDPEVNRWLADTLIKHANFYLVENEVERAAACCSLALDRSPEVEEAAHRIKASFQDYCSSQQETEQWLMAEQAMVALVQFFPADMDVRRGLADTLERQGDARATENLLREAQRAYTGAIESWQILCQTLPEAEAPLERLAHTWIKQGRVYLATTDVRRAKEACQQALAEWPGDLQVIQEVKDLFTECAEHQAVSRNWADAEHALAALFELQPQSRTVRRRLADLRVSRGDACFDSQQYEEAVSSYQRALEDYQGLGQAFASDPELRQKLVDVWRKVGQAYQELGQQDRAYEALTRAIEIMDKS
jgi:tetratricopeptide (TPR) repeat protein